MAVKQGMQAHMVLRAWLDVVGYTLPYESTRRGCLQADMRA
jgi:hypothetical protein